MDISKEYMHLPPKNGKRGIWIYAKCVKRRKVCVKPCFKDLCVKVVQGFTQNVQTKQLYTLFKNLRKYDKLRNFGGKNKKHFALFSQRVTQPTKRFKWPPVTAVSPNINSVSNTCRSNPWPNGCLLRTKCTPQQCGAQGWSYHGTFSVPRRGSNLRPLGWQPPTLTTRLSETN